MFESDVDPHPQLLDFRKLTDSVCRSVMHVLYYEVVRVDVWNLVLYIVQLPEFLNVNVTVFFKVCKLFLELCWVVQKIFLNLLHVNRLIDDFLVLFTQNLIGILQDYTVFFILDRIVKCVVFDSLLREERVQMLQPLVHVV